MSIITDPTPVIDAQAIADLRTRVRGPVSAPGEAGYDEARSIWNAMIDRRPGVVARCLGVADIISCVNFTRERELLLSIKGGGHNIAGLSVCDGGLMLDLSLMRGTWIDAGMRIVRAQAGCLLGDVDRETQVHGLAAVLGFVSNTGIAGLTLGGGFGYLTRRYGYTSDNLLSVELVTAEGQIARASERENNDLFWALRGGGGNFGVATNFEYQLHPVGPEIIGGAVAWKADQAEKVLELYRNVMQNAPVELTPVIVLRRAPPAPWLPKEIHGQPVILMVVCHSGSIAEGEELAAPIKSFGKPVGDILQRRSYTSQQSLLDATQPKGRRYYWKSEYLPTIDSALVAPLLDHAARISSPHSAIVLFPVSGALNQLAEDYSAAGNRNAAVILNITASWEKPEDDGTQIEWARTAWRELRRFSTGGTYINFLTDEEGDERIQAAYGANYDRLAQLKAQWDPRNLFRVNKNVAPSKAETIR